MSLKAIEKQALKLPISDRKKLIQSLLTSIEKDTQTLASSVLLNRILILIVRLEYRLINAIAHQNKRSH